ncbi:class I SAM-dependent methyltransferase [Alphaproteobacteria bacterium]|nr:class I SAM-dependent methyltransferase [Alphaproteobacteria bacterium]
MPEVLTEDQSCIICGTPNSFAEAVCTTKDFCYETCSNEFEYLDCKNCGNIYLRNRPKVSELSTIYPNNYLTYDYEKLLGGLIFKLRNKVQSVKVKPLLRHLDDDDYIVDVGCGAGDFLSLVKEFGKKNWRLLGVDFSEAAIKKLESRGIEGLVGRIEDQKNDQLMGVGCFVMLQLIEHVENPKDLMQHCVRMLRPGGIILIETPNPYAWDPKLFKKRYWGCWHAPRHWNILSPDLIKNLAKDCGLEVVEHNYTLNPFGWLHSVQYLLREKFNLIMLGKWFDVDKIVPLCAASLIDVIQKTVSGKTSNQQIILRKIT